jgi:quercetin dioxygenase-like cupin family protein
MMKFGFWHSSADETPIRVPAIGLELRVQLPPEASGGAMTIIETTNAPGFGPPLHRHPQTEVFCVLEGRYVYESGGERFTAEEGDVVSIPGGTVHAFCNLTDKPARQLVMILPALDATAFFIGLGDVMRDGVPDRDALNRFAARWEVEFLGPPLAARSAAGTDSS